MTDLELFRSWVNDFLTVDRFAEHHGLTREQAITSITLGRDEHNALAAMGICGAANAYGHTCGLAPHDIESSDHECGEKEEDGTACSLRWTDPNEVAQ